MHTHPTLLKPVVLGGTGFLGFHIIHALLAEGLPVRATRRPTSITLLLRKLRQVEKVTAELDDPASIEQAVKGCDVAFMAAGHYPRYSVDPQNQIETGRRRLQNVFHACEAAGVRRVVYTSSVTTVAPPQDSKRPADESDFWTEPPQDSVYFQVKQAMEDLALEGARKGGLEIVITCPTGCLGEYAYKSGTGFFFLGLAHGTLPYVVDGSVNIVDAALVARAHVEAARLGQPGERYILGGPDITTRGLLSLAADRLGVSLPKEEISLPEALTRNRAEEERCAREEKGRPTVPVEFLDMMRYASPYSSEKAEKELGFSKTDLPATADRTIAWYRANGFLPK